MLASGRPDEKTLDQVFQRVLSVLSERYAPEQTPHVEEIQNIVEQSLMHFNLYEVAKAYVIYRKDRERIREEKKRILGKDHVDEVDKAFSLNAISLLAERYLQRDASRRLIETPKQLFQRIAALVVLSDLLHDPRVFEKNGGQAPWPLDEFDSADHEGKMGLGRGADGRFEVTWSRYHLERMRRLYEELNQQGTMRLSWADLIGRLAGGDFEDHYPRYREYYEPLVERRFLPNSPTLFNAGARLGQLSACFVLPIEDSIQSIMKAATDAAIIFKSGGGIGINYSPLRPEGDSVSSTGGVASGPVSFMRIIDTVTDVVKQGGKRRGANMGILDVGHADVEKFIRSKEATDRFENFNISVLIPPEFWQYYDQGKPWPLRNPRDGASWETVDPRGLLREMATLAWRTADPGVLFLDNINKHNPLKQSWGDIRCTNPCGEEPMYPYESCNLGSINVYAFVRREDRRTSVDWDGLAQAIRSATRFLDNIIDLNHYPLPEIERVSKATRRIGLGIMGLADLLYALGVPYNSEEGFNLMSRMAEFFAYHSAQASLRLSRERGRFPLFNQSSYRDGNFSFEGFLHPESWRVDWKKLGEEVRRDGLRNSHTMTIAPTGSISMLADVASGFEPQFAIVFEKHVSVGTFYYTDIEFERQLHEAGRSAGTLLKKIADNGGSLQGLDEVLEPLRRSFLVAYDIPWWDHVRAQFEVQKWVSAAVSKTINMPVWASVEEVEKAFLFAYRLGLKGITVYRDTSKGEQVLRTQTQRQNRHVSVTPNGTIEMMRNLGIEPPKDVIPPEMIQARARQVLGGTAGARCPSCGSHNLSFQEACEKCLDCGWSTCVIG